MKQTVRISDGQDVVVGGYRITLRMPKRKGSRAKLEIERLPDIYLPRDTNLDIVTQTGDPVGTEMQPPQGLERA